MEKPIFMWFIFIFVILFLLLFDLGFLHRKNRIISFKESLGLSLFYIIAASLFGIVILYVKGLDSFAEYMIGFLVEKSLALDNIFLISIIFSSLSIPLKYQHRVLFWGILGVIIFRAIMISIGAHIIEKFAWILYLFSIFMIFTGIKMFFIKNKPVNISENKFLIWIRNHFNITSKLHGNKFFIYQKLSESNAKTLFITPLFLSLLMIEVIDLIFAFDSIPAIFTITQDIYIIYTSNIFAILGLRAMYFALAVIVERFFYLKYGLAVILIFIGSKIFITDALNIEKIPPIFSLTITLGILFFSVIFSIFKKR